MKKSPNKKFQRILFSVTGLCLLLSVFSWNGCVKKLTGGKSDVVHDTAFSLIVWKNPELSKEEFTKALHDFKLTFKGPVDTTIYCLSCDSDLVELRGDGPRTFIQGQVASGGSTSKAVTKVRGGGAFPLFYYSANFTIKIPDLTGRGKDTKAGPAPKQGAYGDTAVTAAVFDTGLDPDLLKKDPSYLADIFSPCLPGGRHGWNFVIDNSVTTDDNDEKHGTVVTDFIIEQANKFHNNKVKILPVKTHGSNGENNLFKVLCGFAYVARTGIKAINASFGYYGYGDDSCSLLFEKYIEHYLTGNNILLICAAGNQDDEADKAFLAKHPGKDPRNLDINPFYPACFSKDLPNVITVTTVSTRYNRVNCKQNYSWKVVDIGVEGDVIQDSCSYAFMDPLQPRMAIYGSSYATPIVTGKICANYSKLVGGGSVINKASIISLMTTAASGPLASKNPPLFGQIKNGVIVKR